MRVYRCIKLQEVINKYKNENNKKIENPALNTHIYESEKDGTAKANGGYYSVMFYCKHKGTNANQQPKAIYTYSDALADN